MSQSNLVTLLDAKHPEAGAHTLKTEDAAFTFLKDAARIKSNMQQFTALWTKLRPKRLKDREVKDRDVLKGLAKLMAEGKLVLKEGRSGGGSEEAEEKAPPPAATRRPKTTWRGSVQIRERPDPTPANPPPPPMDVAKQVEALLAAAKSGAPFVEQCTR